MQSQQPSQHSKQTKASRRSLAVEMDEVCRVQLVRHHHNSKSHSYGRAYSCSTEKTEATGCTVVISLHRHEDMGGGGGLVKPKKKTHHNHRHEDGSGHPKRSVASAQWCSALAPLRICQSKAMISAGNYHCPIFEPARHCAGDLPMVVMEAAVGCMLTVVSAGADMSIVVVTWRLFLGEELTTMTVKSKQAR